MASSSKGVDFVRQIVKKAPVFAPSISVTRFSSSSSGDFDRNVNGQQQQQLHPPENPPKPLPDRPLRGYRPSSFHIEPSRSRRQSFASVYRPSTDGPFETHNHDAGGGSDTNLSDQSFLQQFKLGIGRSNQKNPQMEQHLQEKQPQPLPLPEDADVIFKKMKETGLIPNAVAMLDGLCKDGLVQEAMKLFGLMREKGTIPEVVIYTAVVEGFCKAHKFEDAKKIFGKMQTNGISPNAFSYTVLIQGLYKCKKLDEAVEFCVEMLEAGHSPNITTFVGLVDALCREKSLEEAQTAIERLRQKGFVVNVKAIKEFMDKRAPFPSLAWEAIFGKKPIQQLF